MRPLEFTLGFLLLLSLVGELFGGPPSSGPYYVTLILWIIGSWFRGFFALFGLRIAPLMSFNVLSLLVFIIWLLGGLILFFEGWFGQPKKRKVGA